jgi:hypothetical protein
MGAIEIARETLKAAFPGLEPIANKGALTELERAQHLLWMCDEAARFLEAGEREKAMRWIGFVQGTLWIMGLRSIDAMREDVRASV